VGEGRQTVLIIDDEKDVHYSFRRLLEKEPLEVLSAESGDEGIRMARKSHPDLIVMDIRMGQQSGLDTLKELRQMNPKQVVIMMTAYGTSQTAIEAMKRGAYDYVLKPFDIPQLKDLLFEALAAARAMKQIVAFPTKLNAEESARPSSAIRRHAAGLQADRPGRADQHDHPHHRRKRHRQGTRGARDLPERFPREQAVHRHQLRRHSGKPPRKRVLRP
jgi:DNA-binding NtrC family response regulator